MLVNLKICILLFEPNRDLNLILLAFKITGVHAAENLELTVKHYSNLRYSW